MIEGWGRSIKVSSKGNNAVFLADDIWVNIYAYIVLKSAKSVFKNVHSIGVVLT